MRNWGTVSHRRVAAFDPEHGGVISAGGVGFGYFGAECVPYTPPTSPRHTQRAKNIGRRVLCANSRRLGTLAHTLNENDMDRMLVGGASGR